MKLSSYAVDQVFTLLSSITTKKHKDCKPTTDLSSEYIVINSLPINAGVLQKCYVNVNCHVKDLTGGVPNRPRIEAIAQSVLTLLEEVTQNALLIDFESQELIRVDTTPSEHYMNLRFSVKIIN